MSRKEIQPTYKIPALVRSSDGQVETTGFEGTGSLRLASLVWRRTTFPSPRRFRRSCHYLITLQIHPSLEELGEGWERWDEWIAIPHCHVA
jgi:hypothetical protein